MRELGISRLQVLAGVAVALSIVLLVSLYSHNKGSSGLIGGQSLSVDGGRNENARDRDLAAENASVESYKNDNTDLESGGEELELEQEALDLEPSQQIQFPLGLADLGSSGEVSETSSVDEELQAIQQSVRDSIDQAQREKIERDSKKQIEEDFDADDAEALFNESELGELERSGAEIDRDPFDDRYLAGVVRQGESNATTQGGGDGSSENQDPGSSEEEVAEPLPRVTGQARGYAMLYLMHPRARETVLKQVQALLDSEVNELYLGVLTDGTFGKDFPFLASVVRELNRDGRILTLALYLTNGSTMRQYATTPIVAGFNKIAPEQFRELIVFDPTTRERFVAMASETLPIFRLNRDLNPFNQNIAVVMLEDNLDERSYIAMRQLAQNVFGDLVEFVRNPCIGCYKGNEGGAFGSSIEYHHQNDLEQANVGDGFTLDGVSYAFDGEPLEGQLEMQGLGPLFGATLHRGIRYVGLWRAERQGLRGSGAQQSEHPDNRNYEVPTEAQVQQEISVLREGLQILNQEIIPVLR